MVDYAGVIKKAGIFDMDSVYNQVAPFFESKMFKVNEAEYKHKKGPYKGYNIEHKWEAKVQYDVYAGAEFTIKITLDDAYDVDVVVDNKKQVMTKGVITVKIEGNVKTDLKKKFDSPFKEKLKKIYEKILIKPRLDRYKNLIGQIGFEFYQQIKEKLEFEASKNG